MFIYGQVYLQNIKLKTAENLPWSWRTYAAPWSLRALLRKYSNMYAALLHSFIPTFSTRSPEGQAFLAVLMVPQAQEALGGHWALVSVLGQHPCGEGSFKWKLDEGNQRVRRLT